MKKTSQHRIDFIFPISLFFVFSATAFITLLVAANIYQRIVIDSDNEFVQSTSLSYVTTKIRQFDEGGSQNIYIDAFNGHDALVIEQEYSGVSYITYIYETEGELKELFVQKGITVSAQSGTTIMKVDDFTMEELDVGLFKFSCTASEEGSDSVIISLSSEVI